MWEQTRGHRQGRAEEKWTVKQAVLTLQHYLAQGEGGQRESETVIYTITCMQFLRAKTGLDLSLAYPVSGVTCSFS